MSVTGAGVEPRDALGTDENRFRQRFGLAPKTPLVAFVGHKTAGKGALHLLDACRSLLVERPNLTLAMVGPSTPAFRRHYRALPAPLQGRILDLSLSEEGKHDLLAASSVLVLPSQHDSFGIGTRGIKAMIQRLSKETGIKFSAHALRRGMAIHNLKQGLSTRVVQALGGWETITMVERYSAKLQFGDALSLYRNVNRT